jgi:hypothetical protein
MTTEKGKLTMDQLWLENQQRIAPFKAKYPRVFSHLEFMATLEGWNDLIAAASILIENYIEHSVPEELKDQVYYSQVKQKFGYLVIYISHNIPYINGVIDTIEALSGAFCEQCGQPGTMKNISNWMTTLCEECHQQKLIVK